MKKIPATISLLAFVCGGCVLSLQPLFTENEVIYDSALVGDWQTEEKDAKFTISGSPSAKSYILKSEFKNQPPSDFLARLGNLGTNRFLEILPMRTGATHAKSFYGGHFIGAYSFWKVLSDGDKLKLVSLNYQWLEVGIKQNKLEIKHEKSAEKGIILSASTEELQAFILKYANHDGAFSQKRGESFVFVFQKQILQTTNSSRLK